MGPPLGSRACPLGLVQPRPGRRSQTGRGNLQARPARPLFATIKLRRSIDPESPAEPREGDNLRATPNPTSRPTEITRYRLRHVPAPPAPGPLWAVATLAPERFAHLRRLSLALLLSALPVTGAGGASLRVRVRAFTAMRGRAANAHKPFDSLGEKHYG